MEESPKLFNYEEKQLMKIFLTIKRNNRRSSKNKNEFLNSKSSNFFILILSIQIWKFYFSFLSSIGFIYYLNEI